ncbi:MAG: phosphoesterase [Alphaproteobacteria bacterium]|nr:phosphoesterase [Alphaproteobacteria bacterium]
MRSLHRFCAILLSSAALALPASAGPTIDTTPGPDVSPYVVAAADEPSLSHAQIVELLRRHIKYVFVIYQENRSFDSYFGTFPGANGLFSQPESETPGFTQALMDIDGSATTVQPFRIGPAEFAADTDDVDHSHSMIAEKIHVLDGVARMDRFAIAEERKYSGDQIPTLMAKQFGELTMAYEDCDTVPFLWRYADRFTLADNMFQEISGPSTPGNLDIIAAQTGVTQWVEHPEQGYSGNGDSGPGEPVVNDADPFWGSPYDRRKKVPVNPNDFNKYFHYPVQYNQTYASLPLTLARGGLGSVVKKDELPDDDLADIRNDIAAVTAAGHAPVAWRWYEEGFDREPASGECDGTDAGGLHASYITHHNGPQYFGYVSNNPEMRNKLRGLDDFFREIGKGSLPAAGGVFYVKGGCRNIADLQPANPKARGIVLGDDDHPGYSDSMISEAMVARAVNAIAASRYWSQSAIIITWDDSEGDYDHVPPTIRVHQPNLSGAKDVVPISDGPRVPLILISPYARAHYIDHDHGSHASVVKFVDAVMGLIPLAQLPDELAARRRGEKEYGQTDLGPQDALTPGIDDLAGAFDPARLSGKLPPLPASYAIIPPELVQTQPAALSGHYGCKQIGIVPTDRQLGIANHIPADFNPRPKTEPTPN